MFLILLTILNNLSYAASLPELPRQQVDLSWENPSTWVGVPPGGDLQTVINNAKPNTGIALTAGATYTGPITLPKKDGPGWITIVSLSVGTALPYQFRVGPSDSHQMAKIVGTGEPVIAIRTDPGAHHYRFIGVEFLPQRGAFATSLIRIGTGGETSVSQLPHHFIFDRVYVHGDPNVGGRRGIYFNAAHGAVIDSHISGFIDWGTDAQAIAITNGPGPFLFLNNYLEASGENLIFGGGDPRIQGLVSADIVIKNNHMIKPLAWMYAGIAVKNIFELKNARRVLVEGNIFENNWAGGQDGTAINLKSTNQEGSCTWCVSEDVTFRYNVVRHVGSGLKIGRDGVIVQPSRFHIHDNIFDDIDGPKYNYGSGGFIALLTDAHDIIFDHNTVPQVQDFAIQFASVITNFTFIDNIVPTGNYGVKGAGYGVGKATLGAYAPNGYFFDNVIVNGDATIYPDYNFYPASINAVGFLDFFGGNFSLNQYSSYAKQGYDGKDIGANFAAIKAAIPRPGRLWADRYDCSGGYCSYLIYFQAGFGNRVVITKVDPDTKKELLWACTSSPSYQGERYMSQGKTYEFRLYDSSYCSADIGRYESPSAVKFFRD